MCFDILSRILIYTNNLCFYNSFRRKRNPNKILVTFSTSFRWLRYRKIQEKPIKSAKVYWNTRRPGTHSVISLQNGKICSSAHFQKTCHELFCEDWYWSISRKVSIYWYVDFMITWTNWLLTFFCKSVPMRNFKKWF